MKKLISFVSALVLALLTLCGCSPSDGNTPENKIPENNTPENNTTDGNVHGEVKELLSVEELVEFHLHGDKYPENFVFDELDGYGRVLKSASSEEEARAVVEEHFTSGWCTTVENKLDVETDLFYGLYAKWAYQSSETAPVTYYDEYVVSFKKDVYDAEKKQFGTKDKDEIKKILDYIYYSQSYQTVGSKVYSSNISFENGKCEYVIYLLKVSYGDWGVQDALSFVKEVQQIDAVTGETLQFDREHLGTVYIDGALTHGGVGA